MDGRSFVSTNEPYLTSFVRSGASCDAKRCGRVGEESERDRDRDRRKEWGKKLIALGRERNSVKIFTKSWPVRRTRLEKGETDRD